MLGVIRINVNPFLLTETYGESDFSCFLHYFLCFCRNSAGIAWKKMYFRNSCQQCFAGSKKFKVEFVHRKKVVRHFFRIIAIHRIQLGDHMMRQSIFMAGNVSSEWFLNFGTHSNVRFWVQKTLKKCDFGGVFELHGPVKNFSCILWHHNGYLKCCPNVGL